MHGGHETLLGEIIQQIDDKKEAERTVKDERSAREKSLQEAGEAIRSRALKRKAPGSRSKPHLSPGGASSNDSNEEMRTIPREFELRRVNNNKRM